MLSDICDSTNVTAAEKRRSVGRRAGFEMKIERRGQSVKAYLSIVVTLSGMTTEVSEVQPEKAP